MVTMTIDHWYHIASDKMAIQLMVEALLVYAAVVGLYLSLLFQY